MKPFVPILTTLLLAACSAEKTEPSGPSKPEFSQQYRQRSITVLVSVSQTNLTTASKIQFMIDVHAAVGTEITFPEISDLIAPFSVVNGYSEPVQRLANGKQLHRRVWSLVPALPGRATFQPIPISAGSTTLQTEPISLKVNSLLPAGTELLEIKDISEKITLLPEEEKKRHTLYFILTALTTLGVLVLLIRQIRLPKEPPIILPHEPALEALGRLPDSPVQQIHALNLILRTYIEARFKIPMVGRTIPEIIPALENHPHIAPTASILDFLKTGEEIRFSNIVPPGFTATAEQTVRAFIEATKEVPPCD